MENNNNENYESTSKDNSKIFKIISIVLAIVTVILGCLLLFGNRGSKITVTSPTSNLKVGESYQIVAKSNKGNENLVYVSENPQIVNVDDSTGTVIATGEGTTKVKVYVKDKPEVYEYVEITVNGIEPTPTPEETPEVSPEETMTNPTDKPTNSTPKVTTPAFTPEPTKTSKPTPTSTTKVTTEENGVTFKESSFSCNAGKEFNTVITVYGPKDVRLQSIKSSDESIAKVVENTDMIPNCLGCHTLKISCLKEGTADITATNSYGTSGSTTVKVTKTSEPIPTSTTKVTDQENGVTFKESSFSCNIGKEFNTVITVYGPKDVRLQSIKSSDESIAKVVENTDMIPNCLGCHTLKISCLKEGTTNISATNSYGTSGSTTVKVTK